MAFIVKKKIGNQEYYYLRESRREGGKVRAKTVAYLGKDARVAEEKAKGLVGKKKEVREKDVEPSAQNRGNNNLDGVDKISKVGDGEKKSLSIDEMAMYCKRRGFVYPSGEIYGGMAGFWDYGPVGAELVKNLKNEWWKFHVQHREDMVGIDGSIITNPKVWEASGHVDSFVDVFVRNKKTGEKTKVDKHEVDSLGEEWEVKGEFNPMFKTEVGPGEDGTQAYLRPETAQLIFSNFRDVWENSRAKLPFGIAQIGKAFRNEISPREFLFRAREFEQMEIEYFISPGQECPYIDEIRGVEIAIYSEEMQKSGLEAKKMGLLDAWKRGVIKTDWHAYWMALEYSWFILLGGNPENFRVRQHTSEERSHYAADTWDLEYKFPMGWRELQGFANRSDFDLKQHGEKSGKKMEVDGPSGGKVLPHVVCEPSLGVGRAFLVFLFDSYKYDEGRGNIVLHLNPRLAPYKAGVFPLVSKGEMFEMAREVFKDLKEEFNVLFDKSGSIGRRYARQDEIGTPYCITVDGESLKDKTATVRDRDSTEQVRVKVKDLKDVLRRLINEKDSFVNLGKKIDTRVKK